MLHKSKILKILYYVFPFAFLFFLLSAGASKLPCQALAREAEAHFDIANARERQDRLINEAIERYKAKENAGKGSSKTDYDDLIREINDIRKEFQGANTRRNDKLNSLLAGSNVDNSGSAPKTINSDCDVTLQTSDPAALAEIKNKAGGYTVTQPHKYKIYIKELDTTVWVQPPDVNDKAAFEEYVKTMANDADAFPTAGGLESTSRPKSGAEGKFGVADPEGAVLSNVHKAGHALNPGPGGAADLHTAAKSLSKAAEITGIKDNVKDLKEQLDEARKKGDAEAVKEIEKKIRQAESSKFWKKVDDLRNHKTPVEAGIVNPRDPPSKQKKDMEKFVGEMNEKLKEAHFEGARQGREKMSDLEKKLDEAQKSGDAEKAKKIQADIEAAKTSNKICKESIAKKNPELKDHIEKVDEELDDIDKKKKEAKPEDGKTKPEGDKTNPEDGKTKPEGDKTSSDGKTTPGGDKPPDGGGTRPDGDPDRPPDSGSGGKKPDGDGKSKTGDAGSPDVKSKPDGAEAPPKTSADGPGGKAEPDFKPGAQPKPVVKGEPPPKGAFGPSVEPKPKTGNFGDNIKEGTMVILSGLQGGGDFSKIIKDEMHKAIKEGRDPDMVKVMILTTWEIGKGELIGATVGWAGGFAGSYIAGAAGAAWGGPIAIGVFVGGMVIYEVGKNGLVDGLGNITGLRPIADLIYTDWEHEFLTEEQFKHLRKLAEERAKKQLQDIRNLKKQLKNSADPKKIDEYKKLIEKTYKNYQNYIKMGGSPDDPVARALRDAIEKAGDLNSIPQDIKHGDPTFIQADREDGEEL
ncbi:MAG: hypothetical protein BWY32_00305 [bacterium ADurb.Bin243]|nr:MAG: hypothetical protein BWY32_00305 [bacterium ADurb.Bin243]